MSFYLENLNKHPLLDKVRKMGEKITSLHGGIHVNFGYCDFIQNEFSHGGIDGLFEIRPNPDTMDMDDVKGYLTFDEVIKAVKTIKRKLKIKDL